jgi:hypothetical protein
MYPQVMQSIKPAKSTKYLLLSFLPQIGIRSMSNQSDSPKSWWTETVLNSMDRSIKQLHDFSSSADVDSWNRWLIAGHLTLLLLWSWKCIYRTSAVSLRNQSKETPIIGKYTGKIWSATPRSSCVYWLGSRAWISRPTNQ